MGNDATQPKAKTTPVAKKETTNKETANTPPRTTPNKPETDDGIENPKDPKDPKPAKTKKDIDIKLAAAASTKKDYASVTMAAQGVLNQLKGASWASSDTTQLSEALDELAKALPGFGYDFLSIDVRDIKSRFRGKDQILEQQASAFTDVVKPRLQAISKQTKMCSAMKAARDAINSS